MGLKSFSRLPHRHENAPVWQLKLKRLLGTGAGLIFKGNGFYQTDYRSESYTQAAQKDKPAVESKTASKKDSSAGTKTNPSPAPAANR